MTTDRRGEPNAFVTRTSDRRGRGFRHGHRSRTAPVRRLVACRRLFVAEIASDCRGDAWPWPSTSLTASHGHRQASAGRSADGVERRLHAARVAAFLSMDPQQTVEIAGQSRPAPVLGRRRARVDRRTGLDGELLARRESSDHGDVDLMVVQGRQRLGGRSETEVDVHEGSLADELPDDVRDEVGPRCARGAEAQGARFRFDESANAAIGLLEQRTGRVTCSARKRPGGVSATVRPPAHECNTDFTFQRGDVLGHRGLLKCNRSPLRRTSPSRPGRRTPAGGAPPEA